MCEQIGKHQSYSVVEEKCTIKVHLASLGCPAMWDHWQLSNFEEIPGYGINRLSFAFPKQMRVFWGQENKEGGKATLLGLSHLFLNCIIKVCSIHLHLQKDSWHVLEMELKNWECWQARCWSLSNVVYSAGKNMQFSFIAKYHIVDRKFKKNNSPWQGGHGSWSPFSPQCSLTLI